MSRQTFYFKRFDRLPGLELDWVELSKNNIKKYNEIKTILEDEING